jgi:cytochrome c-type biogenesis protein CcmH
MTFWIVALALAAVSALLIVLALLRGGGQALEAADYDLKVYRDQLREVEKDVARRVLSPEDAERATIEISRRILEADRARTAAGTSASQPRGLTLGAGAVAALAVVAGGALLYRELGAPGYPDLPLEARIAFAEERRANRPAQQEVEATLGPPAIREDVEPEPEAARSIGHVAAPR